MKRTRHPLWQEYAEQADRDLAVRLPAVVATRQRDPNWRNYWPGHRSLQLIELHEFCLQTMPKMILELGTGYTTFVMARYAVEFKAKLVSVEENMDWLQNHVAGMLPQWNTVSFWGSPVITDNGTRRYETMPSDLPEIDLLYVDGPNCDYMGKSLTGSDAVKLVQSGVRPKHILFDMRHASVDLFRSEVDGYCWEPGMSYEIARASYLRGTKHHSWFWRK